MMVRQLALQLLQLNAAQLAELRDILEAEGGPDIGVREPSPFPFGPPSLLAGVALPPPDEM